MNSNAKVISNVATSGLMAKKLMIQFVCPKCSRELAWAYENASVYCRACDRWVRAGQLKYLNPAKIDPDQDQLILF